MRKILIAIIIFLVGGALTTPTYAQKNIDPTQVQYDEFGNPVDKFGNPIDPSTLPTNLKDSTEAEIESLSPQLYMWKIDEKLGIPYRVPADTLFLNFQNSNLDEGLTGQYNHLGNLGSPRISRIFYKREQRDLPFFMEPFNKFYYTPSEHFYTNSNIPYTNLTYYKAGNRINGEDYLKAYFSVNINKRLAVGFNFNYLYGRGYYQSQHTSFFNGGVFASYHGEKYQSHFVYNNFTLKMAENGGITDDRYITSPEDMAEGKQEYESQNIPTHLSQAWNRNNNFYAYYNQRYNLGFRKETRVEPVIEQITNEEGELEEVESYPNDSIITEFIPVTSFIHTIKVERTRHKFITKNEPDDFFENTYIHLDEPISDDLTTYTGLHNTFGISLTEGFNKYAKAGLTAFISHKANRYILLKKDIDKNNTARYLESQLFVGGELAKRKGASLNYGARAEFGISKNYTGNFRIDGDIDYKLKIKKDTLYLKGFVNVVNQRPDFYKRHYHSNHFYWDEGKNGMFKFKNEFHQKIGGEISFPKWDTKIIVSAENLKNHTYFGGSATPEQYSDNIQVLGATLQQNFKLGIVHLDSEVTWQKSSKEEVIPLPTLNLYHNLYLQTKLAKNVLSLQVGADVRYFTKYKALTYMPGIQQFHLQPEENATDVGGYPIVNIYANLHFKKSRIFAMLYHVNQGIGSSNYFYTAHYPINPRLFKIGISWNLYD